LDGRDLANISDTEFFNLYFSAPVIYTCGATKLVRLSRNLVMKGGSSVRPCEANAMNCAAIQTRILTPKCHRLFWFCPNRQKRQFQTRKVITTSNWLTQCLCLKPVQGTSNDEIELNRDIFDSGSNELPFPDPERHKCGDSESDNDGYYNSECEGGWFIVMDYVQGRSLDHCWENLNEAARKSVALQTAKIIDEMQSVSLKHLPPGPIGGQASFRGI
jgi:hypothetical protein